MIVACGPESNGTRLLTRILLTSGEEVIHRSLPHGRLWWSWRDFPEGTRFVVIIRDIEMAVASEVRINPHVRNAAKYSLRKQRRSRRILSQIPSAVFVSYETLVIRPHKTINDLGTRLGLQLSLPEEVYDANAKYRKELPA